jgi:hypothetical protein
MCSMSPDDASCCIASRRVRIFEMPRSTEGRHEVSITSPSSAVSVNTRFSVCRQPQMTAPYQALLHSRQRL